MSDTGMSNAGMSNKDAITIRQAGPEDAATIIALINDLSRFVEDPPTTLTPEDILRDGFGPDPWFIAFLAERNDQPLGLVLAYRAYATDLGNRGLYVSELYVEPAARGAGAGRALMQAVAEHGRDLGCGWIGWDVWTENKGAYAFYENLGARHRDDVSLMVLEGSALEALISAKT